MHGQNGRIWGGYSLANLGKILLLSVLTFSTFSIFSSSKSNAAETVFECLACPAGQACGDGIEPTPCPAGTYAIQGSSKCVSCLNTGVATCDATNGKATSCKAGYGFNSSNGTCSICSVGTYSAGGTGACKSCSDVTHSSWSASCGSATQTKTTYSMLSKNWTSIEADNYKCPEVEK